MRSGAQYALRYGIVFLLALAGTIPGLAGDRPNPEKSAAAKPDKPHSGRPSVAVTISKETTFITGPLRKDGYVDYLGALNERCRQGVTVDNNASVLYHKAMGPGEIPKQHREQFFKMLGIPPLAERGDYFQALGDYIEERQTTAKAAPGDKPEHDCGVTSKQLIAATNRPWSKKEFPWMAGWLAANEKPLTLLTDAVKRPKRYDPLVYGDKDSIIAVVLPAITLYREVARAIVARAMLRVGEGKVDAAWEDLLSCHRLARFVGQRPTLIDALVAIAIDGMACSGDQALLRSFQLTAAQSARMRRDLDSLPPISKMADTIDFGERFFYLDLVSTAARDGLTSFGVLLEGVPSGRAVKPLVDLAAGVAIDWNEILRLGNSWYDRLTDAFRKPTRAERKAAMGKINEDIRKLDQSTKDLKSFAVSAWLNPRQAVSRRIGAKLVTGLPVMLTAADAEDRGAMQCELIRIGFALAEYRADHGSYPPKLSDLTPKYVAQVPKDIFTAADLHYRQEGTGYVLYSVGCNGKDDGGKGREDQTEGNWDLDDLALRVPKPTVGTRAN